MAELFNQFDVNIKMLILQSQVGSGEIDLLSSETFQSLTIYEDMFATSLSGRILLKDTYDWGSLLPLTGEEILWMDIGSVDTSGGERTVEIPPMFVYSIHPIEDDNFVHGKQWVLDFSSWTHIAGNWDETHLEEGLISEEQEETDKHFMGPIHELAKKMMDNNPSFTDGWGSGDHEPKVDETFNSIYYKPNQGSYSVIRKDTQQRPFEVLTQLAENAVDKENPNAANFVFYQDLDRWNFRSVENLIKEGKESPVKTLYGGIADGETNSRDRIVGSSVIRQANNFDSAQNGMFASTMNFFIPKPKVSAVKILLEGNIKSFYYKVNCRMKDHFPAAIVGFEQIEDYEPVWKYAFAEVYLVFDYGTKKPSFKIKPLEQGGIRSWITWKEDGPHLINGEETQYDWVARPAMNTMEMGNDGQLNYGTRQGWEAPGYRLDSELWEKSCTRIQPIRGSFEQSDEANNPVGTEGKNNTKKYLPTGNMEDDAVMNRKYPVVDMKIYYDQEGESHFFFTAANAVDGECNEDDNGKCKDCESCNGS